MQLRGCGAGGVPFWAPNVDQGSTLRADLAIAQLLVQSLGPLCWSFSYLGEVDRFKEGYNSTSQGPSSL